MAQITIKTPLYYTDKEEAENDLYVLEKHADQRISLFIYENKFLICTTLELQKIINDGPKNEK